MSILEVTQAANRLQRAVPNSAVNVEDSGNGRSYRVTITHNGEEFFESGTPQYLLGFFRGYIAGATQ